MEKSKRTIVNMFSGGAAYAIPMAINFFATPFIVKKLGTEGYGLSNLVNLIIGYLTVMDMGLDVAITKNLSEDRAKRNNQSENRLLNTSLLLYAAVGTIGAVSVFFSAGYLATKVFSIPLAMQNSAKTVFQIASAGFFFSMLNSFTKAVCNGLHRYDYSSLIGITGSVGGIGLGIIVLFQGMGIVGFVSSKIIFIVGVPLIALMLFNKILPTFKLKIGFDKEMIKRLWSYMAYGLFLRISGTLLTRLDQTLLGIWVGVSAVGQYSIPFMIASMVGYGISSILGFVLPMASELYHTNRIEELQKLFVRLTLFITIVCSLAFIPIIVLGRNFLNLWIGQEFGLQTHNILTLLLIASCLSTILATNLNNVVIGIGKMKEFTIYSISRSIVLGGLCLLLIKHFGGLGAAFSVLGSCIIDAVYFNYCVKEYLKLNIIHIVQSAIIKPAIPGILLGFALSFISHKVDTWFLLIGTGLIFEMVLISIYFVTGIIKDDEKGLILKMVRLKR